MATFKSLAMCCLVSSVVLIRNVDGGKDMQAGFTLRHFTHTGAISIKCNGHQLPKDTSRVLSLNMKKHVRI